MQKLKTPFVWIGPNQHPKALIIFTLLTICCIAIDKMSGVDVSTSVAPYGILSYEFAGIFPNTSAAEVVAAWDESQRMSVAFNLGLGFFFLVGYSHTIGIACLLRAKALNRFAKPVYIIASLQLLVATLDAIENFSLWQLLIGSNYDDLYILLSNICTIPKFVFVLMGLLFCILSLFFKKKID
ncbi:MAG: hypothetical protein GY810_29785 [Aureispira sp.]|nr:hypothetical protein [Aureispira sp.]